MLHLFKINTYLNIFENTVQFNFSNVTEEKLVNVYTTME